MIKNLLAYTVFAAVLVFWLCQAFPGAIPGTVVGAKVTTGNTASTFPVADTSELHGGFMQLSSLAERNTIPAERRKNYMLVDVDGQLFQLYSGSKWRAFTVGGSAPDLSDYARLRQSATFDRISALGIVHANGFGTGTYPNYFVVGNTGVVIAKSVGVTRSVFAGYTVAGRTLKDYATSTAKPIKTVLDHLDLTNAAHGGIPVACGTDPATAIFDGAPGAQGIQGIQGERGFRGYSGARGFRGYSGARGFRGYTGLAATIAVGTVETLSPSTPAYVTNVGTLSAAVFNIGIPKGEDGGATITQAQVLAVLDDQSTGMLTLQGAADSDVKAKMLYSSGAVSLYITSAGLIYAQDASGKLVWGWDNNNKTMKFSNWSTSSSRVNLTIDQKGQIHQYAANGTTLIFERHTSGRQKSYYRSSGKLAEHVEPDGKRTLYRPDGVTARMTNYTAGRLEL